MAHQDLVGAAAAALIAVDPKNNGRSAAEKRLERLQDDLIEAFTGEMGLTGVTAPSTMHRVLVEVRKSIATQAAAQRNSGRPALKRLQIWADLPRVIREAQAGNSQVDRPNVGRLSAALVQFENAKTQKERLTKAETLCLLLAQVGLSGVSRANWNSVRPPRSIDLQNWSYLGLAPLTLADRLVNIGVKAYGESSTLALVDFTQRVEVAREQVGWSTQRSVAPSTGVTR